MLNVLLTTYYLYIWYAGLPFPPKLYENGDSVENLCLTWQRQKSDLYYLINTSSGMRYNETSTELCLEVANETALQLSVVAVNCAGRSEPAIANISMGMSMIILCDTSHHIILPQLAVVLPVHQ